MMANLQNMKTIGGLKDKSVSVETRTALLCEAWLLYTSSSNTLSKAVDPDQVMRRVVPKAQWDTSLVQGLPDVDHPMECSEYDEKHPDECWGPLSVDEWDGNIYTLSYGSLMNSPAEGMIGTAEPVIVLSNLVRAAVLLHPDPSKSNFGFSPSSRGDKDAESTRYTVDFKDPDNTDDFQNGPAHLMNGVVQHYDLKVKGMTSLNAFRDREGGYQLMQVPVVDVKDVLDPSKPLKPRMVFTLRQTVQHWAEAKRLASDEQGPNIMYAFDSLSNDETKMGQGFNRLVGDSTFLVEDGQVGKKTMAQYIKEQLEKEGFTMLEQPTTT